MGLVLFSDLSCENLATIFMKMHASACVCMHRNTKGLSAAVFLLCHPVDLLAFNQREKILF